MHMFTVCLLVVVLHTYPTEETAADPAKVPGDNPDTCQSLKQEAQQIRKEGYTAIDKANSIREEAHRLKDEAFEMKESEMKARSELESTLVETIALIRSQSTFTNQYIQDIKGTLSDIKNRMEKIEETMEEQEGKEEKRFSTLSGHSETLEKKMLEQAAVSSSISSRVTNTLSAALTLKTRQEAQISEIRMISLYKVTGQNNPNSDSSYSSDLAVDGMMTFDKHHWSDVRTYSHTGSTAAGNKLWLELGGWFRIHKIKIWNLRHCCQEQLVGAHIYADTRLIGTVVHVRGTYDFTIADEDAVYAREVTLQQPLGKHLHILELQVWGSGPYPEDDTSY